MRICVIGAGSWGTALGLTLAANGHEVTLWGHDPHHMARVGMMRCNDRYLPGISFPANLRTTDDLELATQGRGIVLIAVPSRAFRQTLERLSLLEHPELKLVWATKGLELETGYPLHRVVEEVLGGGLPAAILSGPTFAGEVARGQPTAVTVASRSMDFAAELVSIFHSPCFRAYSSSDVVGVELGGAIKNVLAIAAGVSDGLGYGANARAALVTRGLAEMIRLGTALGGKPETLMGLAGVGDLILTATDDQSRNRRYGLGLGRGGSPDKVKNEIGQEIEGIPTAKILHRLALELGIEMPITEQTYRILHEGLSPDEAVGNLLLRDPKPETELSAKVAH